MQFFCIFCPALLKVDKNVLTTIVAVVPMRRHVFIVFDNADFRCYSGNTNNYKGKNNMDKKAFKSFKIPEEARQKAHKKYVKYRNGDLRENLGCGAVVWFALIVWNLIAGLTTPSFSTGDAEDHNMNIVKKVEQRARDMFYPISNGWHTSLAHNSNGTAWYFKYFHDESAKGKFKPRVVWIVNMACLLVAAYWALNTKAKQKRANKMQENTVDMMLKMPFVGCDEKQVKKLMKIAPDIVSRMSQDRRVYFDALVNPGVYADMKSDIMHSDSIRDMAIEIMVGHLASHPEDMERAIRVCSDTAIPQRALMNRLNQNER